MIKYHFDFQLLELAQISRLLYGFKIIRTIETKIVWINTIDHIKQYVTFFKSEKNRKQSCYKFNIPTIMVEKGKGEIVLLSMYECSQGTCVGQWHT